MKTIGIILGSGIGNRFGASFPKQFMSLNGKMVIQYAIDAMKESKAFDEIYCTLPPDINFIDFKSQIKNVDKFIIGGKTRTETIGNVLSSCSIDTEYIVFHDSVRPFVRPELFVQGLEALKYDQLDYLLTGQKITDALAKYQHFQIYGENRNDFYLIQTPEFFQYKILCQRFCDLYKDGIGANNYTYIGQLFNQTDVGDIIEYNGNNLKITYEEDLFNAEQLMKYAPIDEKSIVDVKDKRILLFGGSGDIGQAIKTNLESRGANVFSPTHAECDLTNPNNIPIYPGIYDCVIYSAGTYITDKEDLETAYEKIMSVNFQSFISVVKLSEQYWLTNGGNIIVIGSSSASYGRNGISLYSASKSAINTFVEAYHPTLNEKNICINVIAPAKVQGQLQKSINPLANQDNMIKPERLAEIVSHYVTTTKTGQIVYVRYGLEDKK